MSGGAGLSRRAVLAGAGGLVVAFSLRNPGLAQEPQGVAAGGSAPLPGSLKGAPFLDSWIRVDPDGRVTVFTGKAELGQGIRTALLQVAAEELDLRFESLALVAADTARTPNEGYTAGSHSMQDSGTAIRNAAAQVRRMLLEQAAERLELDVRLLKTDDGAVVAPDGRHIGYGELASAGTLHVEAQRASPLKDPGQFRVMNRSVRRVDIPAKVTGGPAYVQDMRPEGMLHARMVRPPSYGAQLAELDAGLVERMPGVVKVVRDGNFLAVVARREFEAIQAMRSLAAAARWNETPSLPRTADPTALLTGLPAQDITIHDRQGGGGEVAQWLEAAYSRPYQSHGSIGPSCAIARMAEGAMTLWTHTQGVYSDREAIAEMLGMPPEQVHCVQVEGSGCYGHNGADDAAADAALIAAALPGPPIRLQWMREQEHAWEPFGPAMLVRVKAGLDRSGHIAGWEYGVWSNTHSTRPGPAGSLLAARQRQAAVPAPPPKPLPQPEGGGDRNAIPIYRLPQAKVVHHFIAQMPVRVSALRSLGAYMNVFAIESFMDELAAAAEADPVEFRLRHLEDPRARDVVSLAAERFGWTRGRRTAAGRGVGFAFARYKNLAAYCAIAAEAEVSPETGRVRLVRAVAAVDAGQIVNPDGIRNQIEGGILQSSSWTLYEAVTYDDTRITSVDWSGYPILRFSAVPDSVEVHLVERPGLPFLGCGEASQGPAAAALGNAVAAATGKRLRDLPMTRRKVKAALGV